MLLPEMKCKVIKSTPLTPAGTLVIIDKDTNTKEVILGKTGKVFCRMPTGGSLFFDESNLEEVA